MAKEIKITKKHATGLYDSANGKTCTPEKIVDVTDDCPKAHSKDKAVFVYTRAERGRIIQMTQSGARIHFFVDELNYEMNRPPRDDTFGSWADQLGLSKPALRTLIETHAPA